MLRPSLRLHQACGRSLPIRLVPRCPQPVAGNSTNLSSRRSTALKAANGEVGLRKLEAPPSASTDLGVIASRLGRLCLPYWQSPEVGGSARWKLAGVVGLTLATTGVSVMFNFLGRDFFNALSEKNPEAFTHQIFLYLGAFVVGIPVFVFKSYFQSKLSLEWRQWMTESLLKDYFSDRSFYQLMSAPSGTEGSVDNPDQRISSDINMFTDTAMGLSLTLLNAFIDLISFSGILFSIYPPLFVALLLYSVGGTAVSIALGKNLVTLNFNQEAREADFRYNLVRVRENAESIAFYRGEDDERALLFKRLQAAVANYMDLLVASRNLDFFTSFYRFLIQLLPAVVVAPLFFQGKIEFGVINQSQSAFNHVLSDMSLVVYQFESLAGFSAVIDRLGQFTEVMDRQKESESRSSDNAAMLLLASPGAAALAPVSVAAAAASAASPSASAAASNGDRNSNGHSNGNGSAAVEASAAVVAPAGSGSITVQYLCPAQGPELVTLQDLTVCTPDRANTLVRELSIKVQPGMSLLIMGPSGAGKTSIMRAVAGLWRVGSGSVQMHLSENDVMFLPQRPYMVLGSLRDQVLYPRLARPGASMDSTSEDEASGVSSTAGTAGGGADAAGTSAPTPQAPVPSDSAIVDVLRKVRLGAVLERHAAQGSGPASGLDAVADWSSSLSLGEQQRVAWARLLLAMPRLALLDEATSALDGTTEEVLYRELAASGITYISIGHRASLRAHHSQLLTIKPQPAGDAGSAKQSWELTTASAAARS